MMYDYIYKRQFSDADELAQELEAMKDYKLAGKKALILNCEKSNLNRVFDVLEDKEMSYEEISFDNYISMNKKQQAVFSEVYLTEGIPDDIDFLVINGDVHENFRINGENLEMLVIYCDDKKRAKELREKIEKEVTFLYTSKQSQ